MSDEVKHSQTQRIEPAQMVEPAFCQQQHAPMMQLLQTINAKLDKWESRMIGNGTPGVLTRLDRIEQAREHHDAEVKQYAERRDRWMHGIGIGVAVSLIGTAFSVWLNYKVRNP